ncbi:YqcI/YcgG family protein [Haloarchaeobius sp. TZWWS8]|uniref:YqcI/YcgG family protein n=1 Tax=Haloarchaeobius sp. TZWWS8 TaxID=3446121 RepID=UPI003EBF9FA0
MSQPAVTGGTDQLSGTDVTRLFDQERLHDRLATGTLPDWAVDHYESFREAMLGEHNGTEFVCYFGVDSEREGWALYTFVPGLDDESLLAYRDVLLAYLRTYEHHAPRASLVTFFAHDGSDLDEAEWHERYWDVLQFLHDHDPEPWPDEFPTEPDDHQFEFCFGGEPLFPTARAPSYQRRHSRHNPHGLEITVQPRKVFEGITGDTEAGRRAREIIQGRMETYDDVCPHAQLGDWEDDESHEWPQYMLPDGEELLEECPLEISR